jgi:hypothetical protein
MQRTFRTIEERDFEIHQQGEVTGMQFVVITAILLITAGVVCWWIFVGKPAT